MYGFRSGMGGLGDTCSQITTYFQPYFTQGPGPGNDQNYQTYAAEASAYGCTPEPESYFTNYTTPVTAATPYANVNDAATAILAQNPNETPSALQGQLSSYGSLATSGVLNAFIAAVQAQLPGVNPNTIGSAVAANWNTANVSMLVAMMSGSAYQTANPVVSTPVQSVPVASPIVSTPVVSAPATTISTPDIPVTPVTIQPSGSSASDAVNVAQQVTASNPDATVQQVAQAIATNVPAATPNQITQAATNAVVAVVQAQVPSAPASQIVDAVTTNPATPPSQIATGVALTQTGSGTASGTVNAQPVGQLIPLSSSTSGSTVAPTTPAASGTVTTQTSLPTLNTSTGNVTPASGTVSTQSAATAATAAATGTVTNTTAASWCFPGDTSAPFSSAIPVCSNTMIGVVGLFAVLLILGR